MKWLKIELLNAQKGNVELVNQLAKRFFIRHKVLRLEKDNFY